MAVRLIGVSGTEHTAGHVVAVETANGSRCALVVVAHADCDTVALECVLVGDLIRPCPLTKTKRERELTTGMPSTKKLVKAVWARATGAEARAARRMD